MRYTCATCGVIGPERYCAEHKPNPNAHRSPNRDRGAQKQFRLDVLKRDRYQCVRCGASQVDLVAAHIKPLRDFAAGDPAAYDPENGRTLCEDCDVATDPYATRRKRAGDLVVLQGTPGAGKTSLAKRLEQDLGFHRLEADKLRIAITGSVSKFSPLVWAQMASQGTAILQTGDLTIESTGTSPKWPFVVEQLENAAKSTLVVCLHGSLPVARLRGCDMADRDWTRINDLVEHQEVDIRLHTDRLSEAAVYEAVCDRLPARTARSQDPVIRTNTRTPRSQPLVTTIADRQLF